MFTRKGKLPQLLPPAAYHEEDFFRAERTSLFARCWQPICLTTQVAKPGDWFAASVGGKPVVVHNQDGNLRAFLNVCAHRHARLVPPGRGQSPRLRCQIHGWEYGLEGRVSRIPDGKSFKGIRPEHFCLSRCAVESAGPFVFVNLDPVATSFRKHLGTFASEFDQYFGSHRHVGTWVKEHPVNWKVIIENTVESYHVPLVHPTTFKDYRGEEWHDHRLEPTYNRYADLLSWDPSLVGRGFRLLARLLLAHPNYERFKHTNTDCSTMGSCCRPIPLLSRLVRAQVGTRSSVSCPPRSGADRSAGHCNR